MSKLRFRLLAASGMAVMLLFGFSASASAATQTYSGNPIQMIITDTARPGMWVVASTVATPYVYQYFSDDAWGSVIHLSSNNTTTSYSTGYQSADSTMTPISNTKTALAGGGGKIVTVVALGTSGVRMTQTFTHNAGERFVSKRWVITNTGSTTYTGARFYHGGDTYFGGSDSAYGFYDPSKHMVYIRNNDFTNWGIMGSYASPSTPASHYYEGQYNTGNGYASGRQNLPDTVNPSYLDAGYYLQWDRATLAPGASWTIDAYETWSAAGPLQIFAPPAQNVSRGQTVTIPYTLQSLNSAVVTITLAATNNKGWTTTLVGGTIATIAPNASIVRNVKVKIPAGATGTGSVKLSGSGDGTATATATLKVIVPPVTPPKVNSKFVLGIPHLRWIVGQGRMFVVYGTLRPAHKTRTKWVRLRFERWNGHKYVHVKTILAYSYSTGSPSLHYGKWTKLDRAGKYRVSARHPADADGPNTTTAWRRFYVR